eukprot:scaffold253_cov72-Cylindrotheca_fusiformis.AAC.5
MSEKPTFLELRQSFGHRVTALQQRQLAEPIVHLLQKQRKIYGLEEFKKLNAKEVTGGHRLQLIHDYPVGAELVVAKSCPQLSQQLFSISTCSINCGFLITP